MAEPTYIVNLINILGENVSFTPTDLAPSETSIVEFDRYYVPPDLSGDNLVLLKNVMREVFEKKLKQIVDTESGKELDEKQVAVFPPCGAAEKAMVLKSLSYRKDVLEQQLFNIGIKNPDELRNLLNEMNTSGKEAPLQGSDSLLARTYLTQYLRLKNFIDKYNKEQFCIHLEDIAYGDLQLDLTDKKVQELLRQFVFFVLQGHHPLQEFKKTDPTAPAYLSRLTRKPLGDDTFKSFLTTYKANKLPIPPSIAKVLEASDMDPNTMRQEIASQVDTEKQKLLESIYTMIPEKDVFWKRVSDKKDLKSVIDALVLYPKDLLNEIKRLEVVARDAQTKMKACEQAKQLLEQQKTATSRLVESLQAQLAAAGGKDDQIRALQEEKVAAEADFARRIADLETQKRDCEERLRLSSSQLTNYIRINQRLNQNIEDLTNQNRELERIAAEASSNLEALRRTHEAQLIAERQATRNEAEARGRAEEALAAAGRTAASQVAELASVRAALAAAKELALAKDRDIAAMRTQLKEKETLEASIRSEIQAKTNELRDVNARLGEARTSLEDAQDQLTALRTETSESKEASDAKDEKLREVEQRILALTTEIENLRIQVKACEDEKALLRGKVSGTSADVVALSTKAKVLEEQKDAALEENKRLSARLRELEVQVIDAAEETRAKQGLVEEKDGVIQQKEIQLATQGEKLTQETRRAETAEAKVAEVEDSKEALEASFAKQLETAETTLRGQFANELSKAKGDFERILGETKEGATAEVAQSKAALDALREVVLAIASNEDVATLQSKMEALPEREALQSILQRLAASTVVAAPGTTPPALMQCYFVFLTSFLWQTNFPTLVTKATTNPGYAREKLFYDVLSSIFLTGPEPTDASGKMRLGGEQIGLYAKIKKASPKMADVTIMKEYFAILQTLGRAIEDGTTDPIVFSKSPEQQAKSVDYLKSLLAQIGQINTAYTGKLTSPSSASSSFAERAQAVLADLNDEDGGAASGSPTTIGPFAKSYMTAHQYGLPPEIFTKTIVIDGEDVKVGSTGDLNYAVLFYCFLVLMRDYLILIENTGAQCKLPSFLKM